MGSSMTIRCECGHVLRAADERRLLMAARAHIDAVHPELADRLSDEDLLAMARVAETRG